MCLGYSYHLKIMALRDQPYLPLYIQDFMTDEKLSECSAMATGVFIRIMCLMHKSETYGAILLKQKDKQNTEQILNFARKLARHLPFPESEIFDGLSELLENDVMQIDGDVLSQKRMVHDFKVSQGRSKSGSKGGKSTQFALAKLKANAKAKVEANTEYEYEYENVIVNKDESEKKIKPNQFSEQGMKFAIWFRDNHKPIAMNPSEGDMRNWAKSYDRAVKDGKTKEQICDSVKWARSHEFWVNNFQSPAKLGKKNKDGVFYLDVFIDQMSTEKKFKKEDSKIYTPNLNRNPITG